MSSRRRHGEAAGKASTSGPSLQPPRILVIDIHAPSWANTCFQLCEALENIFALACSLRGTPRIPLLSLYVTSNRQECLLPFTPVKGNFARLQGCLAELRALPFEGAFRPMEHLVAQAVQDGLQQFKQYTRQGMAGANLSRSSVEITILTSQSGTELVRQLEASLQGTDLVSLRQLQVIEISKDGFQEPSDADSASHIGEGAGRSTGEHSMVLGTDVDLQVVLNDVVALEMFFKGWFHDHSADQEHLHLLLPTGAAGPRASLMCLKCDIQERLLTPAQLPAIYGEDTRRPFWMGAGDGPAVPRLRVIRALKARGLCQSMLFGLPLIIRPTNCWQLSWEELEANQHHIQALCHCLGRREWLLLAKLELQGTGASGGLSGSPFQVLIPSDSSTLLLRSIAVQEHLLPCSLPPLPAEPPKVALNRMENFLDSLEVEPAYNPLNVTSYLYRTLSSSLDRASGPRPPHPGTSTTYLKPMVQMATVKQSKQQPPSKAKATVAPLHLAPPAIPPLFSSEDEEFADPELT